MATRGRPIGTRKRHHAGAAARAICAGQFTDIREAALAHFAAHTGRKAAPLTMAKAVRLERFGDFVAYVEEALRTIIRTEPGSFRAYRAMNQRYRRRMRQPIAQRKALNNAKRHLNDVLGWALEIRDPI